MQLVESPPARRVRRGYLRALLLAPLVFLMGLGLSFTGPAAPAYASASDVAEDLADLVIAGGKKAAPAVKTAAVVGSRLNPASLAVTTLGWAAWETSDIWLPWAKDKLGMDGSDTDVVTTAVACVMGLRGYPSGSDPRAVFFNFSTPNCPGGNDDVWLNAKDVVCNSGAGPVTFYPGAFSRLVTLHTSLDSGAGSAERQLCGEGQSFLSGQFMIRNGASSWNGESNVIEVVAPFNVDRYQTTTEQECKLLDGTIVTISRTVTGHAGVVVPSCEKAHPGSIPWTTTVKGGPVGTTLREQTKIIHNPDVREDYPDCFDALGTLQCKINVWIDGNVCKFGDAICAQWKDLSIAEPQRVECKFGGYVVPLAQCEPLRRAYVKAHTVTKPGPNGEPQLDPDAPEPTPTPTPTPTTNPTPQKVDPSITIGAQPPTIPDPDQPANCLGAGWSWNPVSWVYTPVKCAFLWAFVPKTQVSVRVNSIKSTISGKAPFSWFSGFAGIPAAVPDNGCPDWRIKVGALDQNVVCPSTYTDAVRAARPVLLVFMASLALWPLIRSTAYAAFPIIKPAPGLLR